MKTDIHPEYVECRVHCSCGNDFTTRATVTELRVELCAECHPFYTGKQKLVDTGGRVERFERRYAGAPEAPAKKDKATEEEGGRTKAVRTPKTRKAPVAARPQRAKFEKAGKGDGDADAKGEGKGKGKRDAKPADAAEEAPAAADEAPAPAAEAGSDSEA